MALIDQSYFFNELNIGQKNSADVSERLDNYIDTYEPAYLNKLLGQSFAALFTASIESPSPEQRFVDIKNMLIGKPSAIAAYVFFWYQRDCAIFATGSGDSRSESENAKPVPERIRQVRAWNIMAERSRKVICHIIENSSIYSEFDRNKIEREVLHDLNIFGI